MRGQRFSSPDVVENQTQMMVVHQNILSTVMLKNVKLSYGNVDLIMCGLLVSDLETFIIVEFYKDFYFDPYAKNLQGPDNEKL